MRAEYTQAVLEAVRRHPDIEAAAITGSRVRACGADEFSDLDLLLVARSVETVRNVRVWLPEPEDILICAFHLDHYCTVLLKGLAKLDLAIVSVNDSPDDWVVQEYELLKGGDAFNARLSAAAAYTRANRAAHLNADVSIDNVVLLLATAMQRAKRGELLSAHPSEGIKCLAEYVSDRYGTTIGDGAHEAIEQLLEFAGE